MLASAAALSAAMLAAAGRPAASAAWTARYGLQGTELLLALCGGILAACTAKRMTRLGRLRDHNPRRRPWLGLRLRVIDAQQFHPLAPARHGSRSAVLILTDP